MTKTYRVAIIGTGRMGGLIEDEIPDTSFSKPYGHFPAYHAIPQTEVVAIANRGAERMERFAKRFGVTNTYLDYQEMILKERPDIVSVTTPSLHRAEPIIFAAEHGVKGIYAEKGLCASLAEADRITAAVKAHNVAFNWGAMRRHHDAYKQLRAAIAAGEIGDARAVTMYFFTDLIKHHPHTMDLVEMLLGDPEPEWVEGRLIEPGDPLIAGSTRPIPTFDREGNRFVAPEGREIGDPLVGFYRVGYRGGVEASFVPYGRFDIDVIGTKGRAFAWDNGQRVGVRQVGRSGRGGTYETEAVETAFEARGQSPTICTILDIIRELETGQRTSGNIDVTMHSVETQFGLAQSHLQGGARVQLPLADRSLYVPGG